jgi:hypothetical protein
MVQKNRDSIAPMKSNVTTVMIKGAEPEMLVLKHKDYISQEEGNQINHSDLNCLTTH